MVHVKSIKVALVALVGVAGSGLALQMLNDSEGGSDQTPPPTDTAALGPDPARPSAQVAERPLSGALVATPRHESQPRPAEPSAPLPVSLHNDPSLAGAADAAPPLRFAPPGIDAAPTMPAATRETVTAGDTDPEKPDAPVIADAGGSAADACAPALDLSAGPAATLSLVLRAPCHAGAVAIITHDAMRFADAIPADGVLDISVPALSAQADVKVDLAHLPPLRARATIEDAGLHARYVLQWEGDADFTLHAFHGGAGMGDPGHMHAGNPFDPAAAGAFTVVLGAPSLPTPQRAHIHSVPAVSADGVRFAIAAHQSDTVCGRAVSAETLGATEGQRILRTPMSVTMPDCDSKGGFVLMPVPHEKALALR